MEHISRKFYSSTSNSDIVGIVQH